MMGGSAFCADACTRVVYAGDSAVATGRTLDWRTPIPTSLRLMPRGESRQSFDVASESLTWTSTYGSVVAIGYNMGVSEGMNEAGLTVNILYMPDTTYTLPNGREHRKVMSSSVWALYFLDNFATVAEAVEAIKQDKFHIDALAMPGGTVTTLHLAISDASGDNAIVEYIDGKLSLHQGKEYNVLTNAPTYDQQLAVCNYWQGVGGMNMLPGTNRSTDRFVRAKFYGSLLPATLSHTKALAGVFGIVRNCSVPMGITVADQPEISTTQWLSLSDQLRRIYYFQLTLSPSVVWVDLTAADLAQGAPQRTIALTTDGSQSGDVTTQFTATSAFKPVYRL
jgi:choloylglycine hydrolase